ncbi:MAG: cobalamin-dependent protein [Rhodospirillaceae bacterium]|nr:cobalamin-dependent protein [Rhodospirillaceae bacterium]
MKICFVRPPSIINRVAYIGSLTPPIGVAYLAASARAAGLDVVVIDAIGEAPLQSTPIDEHLVLRGLAFEEIVRRIPRDADIIAISGMFSSEWTRIRPLVHMIAEHRPDAFFIGGGEHFSAAAELCLEQCPGLDAIALGEGEETLVDLARALQHSTDLSNVSGLVIRKPDAFHRTAPRPRLRKLDEIPEPAWDLVPLENYLSNHLGYGVDRGRSMPMLASRGCPYQCTFCSNPQMWGTRWIARNPVKVADEIERYVRTYSVSNVDFYDLTAIVKRQWIIDFCRELIRRELNITWQLPSGTRSEAIDREVAQLMYASGCRNMNYAPESGSEKTLTDIKKKVKLPRLTESLRDAVSEKVNVKINIILGLPDDRHVDVWMTLRFLVAMSWHGANDVSVGAFAPYPGSELYDRLVASGRITHSDEYFSKLAYVDISETVSYCPQISSRWLRFYVWLGFATFYGSNYLFRPWRLVRTLRNILTNKHESRGEMALSQLLGRLRPAPTR